MLSFHSLSIFVLLSSLSIFSCSSSIIHSVSADDCPSGVVGIVCLPQCGTSFRYCNNGFAYSIQTNAPGTVCYDGYQVFPNDSRCNGGTPITPVTPPVTPDTPPVVNPVDQTNTTAIINSSYPSDTPNDYDSTTTDTNAIDSNSRLRDYSDDQLSYDRKEIINQLTQLEEMKFEAEKELTQIDVELYKREVHEENRHEKQESSYKKRKYHIRNNRIDSKYQN